SARGGVAAGDAAHPVPVQAVAGDRGHLVGPPPPAVPAGGRDRVRRVRPAVHPPPAPRARARGSGGREPLPGRLALTCCCPGASVTPCSADPAIPSRRTPL